MMTNEIPCDPCEKHSIINFSLKKIIWHVISNVMTKEIPWLPCEKYFRIKF
jgi:hypothetical protein